MVNANRATIFANVISCEPLLTLIILGHLDLWLCRWGPGDQANELSVYRQKTLCSYLFLEPKVHQGASDHQLLLVHSQLAAPAIRK